MNEPTPREQAQSTLTALDEALQARDIDRVTALFRDDCYWRDLVTFTWNIRTSEGHDQIRAMLESQLALVEPSNFVLTDDEVSDEAGIVTAWFNFETKVARGWGLMRLEEGRIWTLLTTMVELEGHEEPLGKRRILGAHHGVARNRKTWLESREEEERTLGYERQPYVVIIGGGQGGIGLGARLRQLGVPTLIIERNERAGDSWRKRYKSLCLHDPVWYDHLPYIPFPEHWPIFPPKDKVGDWLEMYTKIMELNYWTKSTCTKASYDPERDEWVVNIDRDGEPVVLRPKHLVLATGMSGKPNVPQFPGMDRFQGIQQHSSQHRGGDEWAGKRAVVIGSNNSAHDIAAALWECGASEVTMVQRSSTHIVRSGPLMKHGLGALYSEEALEAGVTTDKADMIFASLPYRIMNTFQKPAYDRIREEDAEFYAKLADVGFMLDWGDDGSGLFMKYLRRGSGYYIDVGACDLVIDGSIKLESGREVQEITEQGVRLSDGKELPADLIVYATGYGSMNGWAADLISQEVADKVGKVWGLGSDTTKDPGPWEGEQRNMWKPTQQQSLWFHGGNLHQSRFYSRFLSLQLKARYEGIDTPVYGIQKVHHLR